MNGTSSISSTARWTRWCTGTSASAQQGAIACATAASVTATRSCRSRGIGQTYTVSPTFLIDGTFGWTRFGQDVQPPDLGTNFGSGRARDSRDQRARPARERHAAMLHLRLSALGNPEGWNPLFRNDQSYTFNTNASWMKGTHDIRFGFDFVHHLMNHWQPELGEGPRGAFHFDPGVTALNPEELEATVGFQGDTHRSRTTGTRWPDSCSARPPRPVRAASSSR